MLGLVALHFSVSLETFPHQVSTHIVAEAAAAYLARGCSPTQWAPPPEDRRRRHACRCCGCPARQVGGVSAAAGVEGANATAARATIDDDDDHHQRGGGEDGVCVMTPTDGTGVPRRSLPLSGHAASTAHTEQHNETPRGCTQTIGRI